MIDAYYFVISRWTVGHPAHPQRVTASRRYSRTLAKRPNAAPPVEYSSIRHVLPVARGV